MIPKFTIKCCLKWCFFHCLLMFFVGALVLHVLLFQLHQKMTINWWHFRHTQKPELNLNHSAQIDEIQRNLRKSRARLQRLAFVLEENAENLPLASHFGTFGPLEGICTGNDSHRCVPPYRHLETRWRIAPKYGLIGCLIQKSLSTLLEAVMCFLYDEQHFLDNGRTLQSEFSKTRFCRRQNEFGELPKMREVLISQFSLSLEAHTFFAIVRDPVERFLSGFVDKCVRQPHAPNFCLGCGANISCFVQREYSRMMVEAGRRRMEKSFEDRHFFPQNWRCNFRTLLANYTLLRVPDPQKTPPAPFPDRLMAFLVRHGISERAARFLREQLDPRGAGQGMTLHSTKGTPVHEFFERRLRGSPFLMEFVVRMFWHDFRIFDFPVPKLKF